MKKITKAVFTSTAGVLLSFLMLSCTESRKATLPEGDAPDILAIDLLGAPEGVESKKQMKLDSEPVELSIADQVKAENENGKMAVASVQVPDGLQFMFKHLLVSGKSGQTYPVTFSVDRKSITAYKVVTSANELSALEKEYALLQEEVALDSKLQKTTDREARKTLINQLQKLSGARTKAKDENKEAVLLVPIFQYKIAAYGVLERTKNDLGEKTSTLQLKKTDWEQATHIKIEARGDEIGKVDVDPSDREALERTFSSDRIDDKIMTAGELKSLYQVSTAMPSTTLVHTVVDSEGLNVFEITTFSSLTQSQKDLVKTGAADGRIWECSKEILAKIPKEKAELKKECVVIYRYVVPVKFVRLELPEVDNFGNRSSTIKIKDTPYDLSVGLVTIPEKVEPKRIEIDGIYDSTSILKVADIKEKEFFFRRTLEDAPETSTFMPGEASSLIIVKFELSDSNLIVRKADKLIDFKTGSNETDVEEVMIIPVVYLRKEAVDERGVALAYPRFIKTNKERAEYVFLDWTRNSLSSTESPLSSYGRGQCFSGIADKTVRDVDMRMEQGVLSFTYQYSTSLQPSEACIGLYVPSLDYNPGSNVAQLTARLKERVSFRLNDKSSDEVYVPKTPFPVQNALGYGVWTIGKFKPTANGVRGRDGQQDNLPVVQDLRAGKKIIYTVTGLPADDLKKRDLYKKTVIEIVEAWNSAYKLAFKGTALERGESYVEVQFSGENGVQAHLGDIDRHIIHFENKFNDNHGVLGVSQVGFNPRSGVVIADSLIIYAGNLSKFVEVTQRNNKIAKDYHDMIAEMKKQALAELAANKKSEEDGTKEGGSPNPKNPGAGVVQLRKNFAREIPKVVASNPKAFKATALKIMKNMMPEIRRMAEERKHFGRDAKTNFSSHFERAYLQRAVEQVLKNPNLEEVEIESIIANEFLKDSGDQIKPSDRFALQRKVNIGRARSMMKAQFALRPGCMYAPREALSNRLAGQTFEQALKNALYFTLGHEMGHSQGLTHNFIGSYDKKNHAFTDETTERNYSSIMDYIEPAFINWAGLGPYDVHAIRAAHTGLIEAHPLFIAKIKGKLDDSESKLKNAEKAVQDSHSKGDEDTAIKSEAVAKALRGEVEAVRQVLMDGKYLHIDFIKKMLAPTGWANFTKSDARYTVKEFLYCTDKDVNYEPTCQRFDFGSSAVDIVKNYIADYEESYINNYHAWDRNDFGLEAKMSVIGRTMSTMVNLRQFMDELFYKLLFEQPSSTGDADIDKELQAETEARTQDYFAASIESYIFFQQLIHTPDAQSTFLSRQRFVAVPYKYKETVKEQNGEDKEIIKDDVQIVEKRAISDIGMTPERLDTIGIEIDKVLAMQFLTMKGLPFYKYASQSLSISYLDFEKYILRVTNPLQSTTVAGLTSMFLDKLQPTFTNDKVMLQPFQDGTAQVSNLMRSYAGIFSVIGLESSTLKDKDNFANLFKVGSSLGKAPQDRIALAQLGVSEGSKAKILYWAVDNASASDLLIKNAAKKAFFIANEEKILKILSPLAVAQMKMLLDDQKDPAKSATLKAEYNKSIAESLASLNNLNKKGELVSPEEAQTNPGMNIEKQLALVTQLNTLIIQGALQGTPIASQLGDLPDSLPLIDYAQKAMVEATDAFPDLAGLKQAVSGVIDGTVTESRYGLIMKNLQFLNQLTFITNPEFNRN